MKKLFLLLMIAAVSYVNGAVLTEGVTKFIDQPYWGGKAEVITVDGKKVLKLTSSIKGDRHFGRAFNIYTARELFRPKEKIVATAKVRGNGKFFIGILKYRPKKGMPETVFVETVELAEKTKEVIFAFEMDDTFERVFPFVQIQGEGMAYIESFKLEKSNDPSIKLSVISKSGNAPKAAAVKKASDILLYRGVTAFMAQPYWGGKVNVITQNGKKVLELVSTLKNGRVFGRCFAVSTPKETYAPSVKIKMEAKISGKGKFQFCLLKYSRGKGAPQVSFGNAFELSEDAKIYTCNIELDSAYEKIFPMFNLEGEGSKAVVESFTMYKIRGKAKVEALTPLQIITPEQSSKAVEFRTSLKNSDVYLTITDKKSVVRKVKSDADGKVVLGSEKFAPGTYCISAYSDGVDAKTYISSVEQSAYAKSDALAGKIKLAKKINILVIGDSLSDFYRGYNYIDRLNFWMNKYNPGKFTFHNAGVGGDFLERTSQRMEASLDRKKKWAYRQGMYNGIFKDVYDYVFIFLGQNDTRCMPKDNYSTPETTPVEQQKYLTLVLKRLKEKCPKAKVVLISPSPSNEALFDSYLAKGRKLPFYGKKKFVDAYDAFNRTFCKENKLDYIDILTPMRKVDPIKQLYVTDGVHLSSVGSDLIAGCILEYFAK